MKLSKLDAAGALLDAAIEHFLRREWVPAIHCGGAAEELSGRHAEMLGGKTVPDGMWAEHDLAGLVANKAEFIAVLNLYRDWIKHTNEKHAPFIDIDDWHAFFSVQRAVIAYGRLVDTGAVPPRPSITRIGEWFVANEKRLEAVLGLEQGNEGQRLAPNFVILQGRAPSRTKQKRTLARLLIARSDLGAAVFALDKILKEVQGLADPLLYPLHAAAVVCYARPFTDNDEIGALPSVYARFPTDRANQAHRDALEIRHRFIAHSDFTARQPRIFGPGWVVGVGDDGREIKDTKPNADVSIELLSKRVCIALHDNCVLILNRLHQDIDTKLTELYDGTDLPPRPFRLRLDAGL